MPRDFSHSLRPHRFADPKLSELAEIAATLDARASLQQWQETLAYQRQSGTLLNTFTTAKSIINADALWDMGRNYLQPGRMLRWIVAGGISNIVTTPGTMNFQCKFGSVAAFDTGALQLNAIAHTTLPFWLDILLRCDTIGATTAAKMMGLAQIAGKMFTATAGQVDSVQDMPTLLAPAVAPAQGTGFDSTVVNLVDFFGGFSISNAGNGVQIQQFALFSLN